MIKWTPVSVDIRCIRFSLIRIIMMPWPRHLRQMLGLYSSKTSSITFLSTRVELLLYLVPTPLEEVLLEQRSRDSMSAP